jgi:hypothetical protein
MGLLIVGLASHGYGVDPGIRSSGYLMLINCHLKLLLVSRQLASERPSGWLPTGGDVEEECHSKFVAPLRSTVNDLGQDALYVHRDQPRETPLIWRVFTRCDMLHYPQPCAAESSGSC